MQTISSGNWEVVLVVGESKNRRQWSHGLVCELLKGQDNIARGVRMIVRNKIWERPIQLVCPLEIKSKITLEELNNRIKVQIRRMFNWYKQNKESKREQQD